MLQNLILHCFTEKELLLLNRLDYPFMGDNASPDVHTMTMKALKLE